MNPGPCLEIPGLPVLIVESQIHLFCVPIVQNGSYRRKYTFRENVWKLNIQSTWSVTGRDEKTTGEQHDVVMRLLGSLQQLYAHPRDRNDARNRAGQMGKEWVQQAKRLAEHPDLNK